MQRLLVIFALGLGLLMPGCAVQDLPFSGGPAGQDHAAPAPYRPQAGAVHDGSAQRNDGSAQGNEGSGSDHYTPQTIPAHTVSMPASTESPQTPSAHAPSDAKPITRTATGLQEKEL